jgi:hypothetical protein
MEEQLVSFETAKLAKEKGFDIETEYKFYNEKEISYKNYADWDIREEGGYSIVTVPRKTGQLKKDLHIKFIEEEFPAPTQSLLQKWLREVHNIHIDIRTNAISGGNYFFYLSQTRAPFYTLFVSVKDSDNYEEALEYALKESLKLIK